MAKKRHHGPMIQRYGTGKDGGMHSNARGQSEEGNPRASKKNGIMSEDHNAMANLPQNVVMEYYPKNRSMMPNFMDDTIQGIDRQMDSGVSIGRSILKPRKA